MTPAKTKAYRSYSEIWSHNRGMITKVDAFVEALETHSGGPPNETRILDVGCGVGTMSLPAASLGYEVVAGDIDEASVRYGQRQVEEAGLETISFFCGPVQEEVVPDGSFDWVILADVLEHIAEPRGFLEMLKGYLKEGGHLWISIPNEVAPLCDALNLFGPYVRLKNGTRTLGKKILIRTGHADVLSTLKGEREGSTKAEEIEGTPEEFTPQYFNYSLNEDSPHLQQFTLDSLQKVTRRAGFETVSVTSGSLLYKCWPLHHVFDRLPALSVADHQIAQRFPHRAGNWWLVFRAVR